MFVCLSVCSQQNLTKESYTAVNMTLFWSRIGTLLINFVFIIISSKLYWSKAQVTIHMNYL